MLVPSDEELDGTVGQEDVGAARVNRTEWGNWDRNCPRTPKFVSVLSLIRWQDARQVEGARVADAWAHGESVAAVGSKIDVGRL